MTEYGIFEKPKQNKSKQNVLSTLLQASSHPFTDLLNLNSPPAAGGGSLLVDVFSESVAPAPADVSEDNFSRWGGAVVQSWNPTFISI